MQPYMGFFFNLILNTVQSSGLNSAIAEEHRNVSVQTLTLTQHASKPGGNETEKENQMRAYLSFVFSVSFSLEVGRTASSWCFRGLSFFSIPSFWALQCISSLFFVLYCSPCLFPSLCLLFSLTAVLKLRWRSFFSRL